MLAALNGLEVMACDLENAYLNAPCMEKIWFEGGLECGSNKGKVCVVVRALYGLKSAGASWHATLAQALRDIGFVSTIADPDVWIQPEARKDGYEYYEMSFPMNYQPELDVSNELGPESSSRCLFTAYRYCAMGN
jgi:hypothetical protein